MASCNLGEKIILWKIGMRLGSWWWFDLGKRVGSIYIAMYMICWRMQGAKEGSELTSVTTQGHPILAFTPSFILLGSRQARRIHVMFSILLWSLGLQLFDILSHYGILRILERINLSFDPVLFFNKVKFGKGWHPLAVCMNQDTDCITCFGSSFPYQSDSPLPYTTTRS